QFTIITPLERVVQISDAAVAEQLRPYLKRIFIIGDLAAEKVAALAPHLRFTLVASDGRCLVQQDEYGRHWRYGISESAQACLVARNNHLAQGEEALAQAEQVFTAQEKAFQDAQTMHANLAQELNTQRNTFRELQTQYIQRKAQVDNKAQQYDLSNTRLGILKERKDEVSRGRLSYLEKDESLRPCLTQLKATLADQESAYHTQQDHFLQVKSDFEKEKEEVLRQQVQAQTWAQRVQDVENHQRDIASQITRDEQKNEVNQKLITQYTEENAHATQEIESLTGEISGLTEKVRLAEGELQSLKETYRQLTSGMAERENEERQLAQSISKTEKEEVEQRLKLEQSVELEAQIAQDIFEKYRVDLRRLTGQLNYAPEDQSLLRDLQTMYFMETSDGPQRIEVVPYDFQPLDKAELSKFLERLRRYKNEYAELGDINWQAIEDYEKQKLRFNFLQEQERELRASLDDLQNAINQIDGRAKARFKAAFEEVNERFEKVFPIIFGGGMAQLKLTSHFEDPECGIDIIARPPGKKMQNINLMSGGEKAMTAVALIFSIFLVRPSPFCLLDEVDAPLDDANVDRFNQLLREMARDSQFILITHNKKTMEMNDTLYGITMQEPGISKAVSVQLH
ncbi:MAG: AAA family ATPase, partial [Bacteriovoracaceae bacterium]|nr:AAA family ATPase [Bacteriovoracaceae bacterium]